MKRTNLMLLTLTALASIPAVAQESTAFDPASAKQLAGPASEIAAMRAPSPVESTIHSKSALLPVHFTTNRAGERIWQEALPLESDTLRFLVFSGTATDWQVNLLQSQGRELPAASLASRVQQTTFGIGEARVPVQRFDYEGLRGDSLTLKVRGAGKATDGFVLIEGDEATQLASYPTHTRQLVGERLGLTALLTDTPTGNQVRVGQRAGRIDRAVLRVTAPDGVVTTYAMFDDGRHDDGRAGDGLYGGDFLAERAGDYLAQVEVRGTTARGQTFVRTAEHLLPVIDKTLALAGFGATALTGQSGRLTIQVPVTAGAGPSHYRAIGEIWGRNAAGKDVAVAWLGGMVMPRDGKLELGLDERWIALANATGPFQLRNLRIEDPDHFITVASAERLTLAMPALRMTQQAADIVVDEAMTMGQRPGGYTTMGVGQRLLLVHGYCSGGVWPAAQFGTASTFLDVNQNRSNDQFALLIRNFGATWNSFGTVAHSQGGMAALHLYTYYWSGLDNATGSRLMQSVGTPYKGTNIAGILATMGSWFGIACGSNSNLTYNGASAWLAGIPTAARAKVNYYTTSFKLTNWYTNDYCQFATDLVLSDPEDGTTEQVNGQLASGVNRGHVTGQCHTNSMRDPAQYLDSSRNGTMNSNAAR